MSSTERQGTNVISRLIGRLTRLRVARVSDPESHITGTTGTIYMRMTAWDALHWEPSDVARWTQPERFRQFLQTGTCPCHPDSPQAQ